MNIVEWEAPERLISNAEVDDFYDQPLATPTYFKFATKALELPTHGGAFSLKLILSGEEEYRVGRRTIRLRAGQFLIINAGQEYSSRISQSSQSMSIFLPDEDRDALFDDIQSTDQAKLDTCAPTARTIDIPIVALSHGPALAQSLQQVLRHHAQLDEGRQLDHVRLLMIDALRTLFQQTPVQGLSQIVKQSTRDELLQRLMRAKTQMDDSQGQSANLDELATVACLSKYYFLRLFKQAFGATPSHYARSLRMVEAVADIERGQDRAPASAKAGYSDIRAFRKARKRLGL